MQKILTSSRLSRSSAESSWVGRTPGGRWRRVWRGGEVTTREEDIVSSRPLSRPGGRLNGTPRPVGEGMAPVWKLVVCRRIGGDDDGEFFCRCRQSTMDTETDSSR